MMIKKTIFYGLIFFGILFFVQQVRASIGDFISNGDVTVKGVNFGATTTDLIIMSGSGAESWSFNSGSMAVVNPDATNIFKVGSSDPSVFAVRALDATGTVVACTKNINPGSSYVSLPSMAGTYSIEPSSINLSHAVSYNSSCGAASCDTGYSVAGSGANAICIPQNYGGGSGGGASNLQPVVTLTIASSSFSAEIPTTTVDEIMSVVSAEKKLSQKIDKALTKRLAGRFLLQVEASSRVWYLDPVSLRRYYLADAQGLGLLTKRFGLGIKNSEIAKIPIGLNTASKLLDSDHDGLSDKLEQVLGTNPKKSDSDGDGFSDSAEIKNGYNPLGKNKTIFSKTLANKLKGRIVIQKENHGVAWYINTIDGKRYCLVDNEDAYQLLRSISLGINNINIRKNPVFN